MRQRERQRDSDGNKGKEITRKDKFITCLAEYNKLILRVDLIAF